jgi:hypothetical protein
LPGGTKGSSIARQVSERELVWSFFLFFSFGVEVVEDDHESETARCDERDLDRQRDAERVCASETDRQP